MLRWSITAAERSSTTAELNYTHRPVSFQRRRRRASVLRRPPTSNGRAYMQATRRPFEPAPAGPRSLFPTPSSVPPSFLPSATTKTTCGNVAGMKEIHRRGRVGGPAGRPPDRAAVGPAARSVSAAARWPGSCVLITRVIGRSIRQWSPNSPTSCDNNPTRIRARTSHYTTNAYAGCMRISLYTAWKEACRIFELGVRNQNLLWLRRYIDSFATVYIGSWSPIFWQINANLCAYGRLADRSCRLSFSLIPSSRQESLYFLRETSH